MIFSNLTRGDLWKNIMREILNLMFSYQLFTILNIEYIRFRVEMCCQYVSYESQIIDQLSLLALCTFQ
jgi:hypothetical protein